MNRRLHRLIIVLTAAVIMVIASAIIATADTSMSAGNTYYYNLNSSKGSEVFCFDVYGNNCNYTISLQKTGSNGLLCYEIYYYYGGEKQTFDKGDCSKMTMTLAKFSL